MAGRLVHFELPVQDADRSKQFYGSLFGWQFQSWDGPVEYYMDTEGNPFSLFQSDESVSAG